MPTEPGLRPGQVAGGIAARTGPLRYPVVWLGR